MAGQQRGAKRSHESSNDDADVSDSTCSHSGHHHSKKRAKSNASAVWAILERAGRATTSFQAANNESNQNFRSNKGKKKQKTKSGSSMSMSTSTVTASKKNKGKEDQNRSQSPITSFGSDHKHKDISNSGSGEDSNGDDKEGSDDGDMDSKMVYSHRLRSHHHISSIDSSDASLLKPGPSMSQVIDIEDSSEDEDNIQ
ncbi:hypothetical protein Moror_5114 [Moniliophthora roreri MCA 2997]|uniref:Uncharacterized protein n=2 Tax=Moniliophthora roreri TaxID=221103 RepID=V2XME7_MONRO|nr:hypothetical protein Moror_5114 [Moniliophthora roreri MCA 2997]